MKKLKVGFLFDKKNSWIKKFINAKTIKSNKCIFNFNVNLKSKEKLNILFILGFTKLIKENFLKKNDYNFVIHESNLPKGKGFSPVQWQIIDSKNIVPVCLILASKKFDSGDIIFKDTMKFNGTELLDEIRKIQANASIRLIKKLIKVFPNLKFKKQKGKSTYFRKRNDKDNRINIYRSLISQINIFRVSDNNLYPAHFIYKKKKFFLKIYKRKI